MSPSNTQSPSISPEARLCSGAADGRAEADQVCRALLDASVVMRLGGLVYLRPDTVAELVVQV